MHQAHVLIFDELLPKGFLGFSHSVSDVTRESGKQGSVKRVEHSSLPSPAREGGGTEVKEKQTQGISKRPLVSELPLWGNFRVRDLLDHFYPKSPNSTIFPFREKGALRRLIKLLERVGGRERIIIGRTGNVTLVDWQKLLSAVRGARNLVKLQVGKVPADLYVVPKEELLDITAQWDGKTEHESGDFMNWLFDEFLFHNFEKILDIRGFSFLLRNSYEYHRENICIADSIGSGQYNDLYRQITPNSLANTVVTESGEVTSSVLGGGVKVEGIVRSSVIFSGVTIRRHSVVCNSVILPSNVVEEGVTISNTLVLEGNRRAIGSGSVIGGEGEVFNRLYPDILKHGLTVIGEGIDIPSHSSIGTGCLVAGLGAEPGGSIDLGDGEVYEPERELAL